MNLKQAAAHLGIHYQTAYKLVRRGRLDATKVGGRYEISDAAIARYETRQINMPIQLDDRDGNVDDLSAAIQEATLTDLTPAVEIALRGLVDAGGDFAWYRDNDFTRLTHRSPRGRGLFAKLLDPTLMADLRSAGLVPEPTLPAAVIPFVPQDHLRDVIPRALHQYLGSCGMKSIAAVPVGARGELVVGRSPLSPPVDEALVELVEKVAASLTKAGMAARARSIAWDQRERALEANFTCRDADLDETNVGTFCINDAGLVTELRSPTGWNIESWIGQPFASALDRRQSTLATAIFEGHLREVDIEVMVNDEQCIASLAIVDHPEPGTILGFLVPINQTQLSDIILTH